MNRWYFWKTWHPQTKFLYWGMIVVFTFFVFNFAYHFFTGPSSVIDWQKISNIEKIKVPTASFRVGLFDFSYEFDNYLITEIFRGGEIAISPVSAAIHLFAVALSLVIILVVISALESFWFYFGSLIFSAILISFKLEQLLLFGQADKMALIICLSAYLSTLYYFNKIKPELDILVRLLTFSGITLIVGIILFVFSEVESPLFFLVNYGMVTPLILSVVFIFILGHCLISFFLKIITRGNTVGNKNSLWHFITISLVYLVNVGFLYAYNAGYIDWDILYVNAFVILFIVAIIGIWDFKDREIQYQGMMSFAPLGALLYLSLAIICFSTLAYAFSMANDPLIEAFEDAIVYSQLGFGGLFMLYIIANFINPMMENMQVYKIMYKPPTFPYGTVQIVGLIAVVAFFLNANMLPFHQAIAGYYNGLGDLYQIEDDDFLAQQYYKLGDQYGFNNHRSNYSLGVLAREQKDESLAPFYFSEALKKKPTTYAQVNLGYELLNSGQFFDAMFSFREGLSRFRSNPYLYNNLAITFGKTSVLDSALHYLSLAKNSAATQKAAETNTLALIGKNDNLLSFSLDSLFDEVLTDKTYLPGLVNTFLLANKYVSSQEPFQRNDFPWVDTQDTTLSSFEFAYVFNYAYSRPESLDSSQLKQLSNFPEVFANGNYYEPLLLIKAYVLYQQNQVDAAMRILDQLQALNPFQRGYYNNMLGIWALEQYAPQVAASYFQKAERSRFEDAIFRKGISYTEAIATGDMFREEANTVWDSLLREVDERIAEPNPVLNILKEVINTKNFSVEEKSDAYKYHLLRFRFNELDENDFQKLIQSFEDPNYRALALHDLWLKYESHLKASLLSQIQLLLDENPALSSTAKIYMPWLQAFVWEEQGEWAKIYASQDQRTTISRWHKQLSWYYAAKKALSEKNEEQLNAYIQKLSGNPLFVKGYLFALNQMEVEDSLDKYNLLLEALETNPYSAELQQAYVEISLASGMESYAESGLEDLKPLVSEKYFQQYLKRYDSLKAVYAPAF